MHRQGDRMAVQTIQQKPFFFRSVQWRLILVLVLITFVLMSVVWVFLTLQVEIITYDQFKEDIAGNYEELSIDETTSFDELLQILRTDYIISGLISGTDRSYTLIDQETGSIQHSSDPKYLDENTKQLFHADIFKSSNLMSVMSGSEVGESRSYTSGNETFYDYVRTQKIEDGRNIILYFKYNRARAVEILDNYNRVIFTGTTIALVAALLIGSLLSQTITKPIKDLMVKAENITAGNFGDMLDENSKDEIGELTRTFNYMSTRLKNMIGEVAAEKNKVETIINHMNDGVIAYSSEGELLHINPAAEAMITQPIRNMNFDQLMDSLNLELRIFQLHTEKFPDVGRAESQDVQIGKRFLKVHFAPFRATESLAEGLVVVLHDNTEDRQLDNMRRQFVADVSHELRTPLTSVKSFTETLLDGEIDNHDIAVRFLTVINDETDRMTRLVKDLLVLSKHDSGIMLQLEEVNTEEMVRSCVSRLSMVADSKAIQLTCECLFDELLIVIDRDRMEQVLVNIIGNAIKYTPEGGSVQVSLTRVMQNILVRVRDTGIGIPKSDLPHIFERFYRVDKARSRQMGGTGLGLAIAMEIVEMHGGTITAESPVAVGGQNMIESPGSELTIRLPIGTLSENVEKRV